VIEERRESISESVIVIDTSTPSTVVVGGIDGVETLRFERDGFRHLECIGDFVDRAERELASAGARLAGIGVVVGPGGFSGLRVGVSFASVFALARDLPLLELSALELTARTIDPEIHNPLIVLDGQRSEVFYALYRSVSDTLVEVERGHCTMDMLLERCNVEQLREPNGTVQLFGSGVHRYRESVPSASWLVVGDLDQGAFEARPWTEETFRLLEGGSTTDPAEVEVLYLRDADARANFSSVLSPLGSNQ
jgi:tRNA threonylcarbamoyl adenosine modification protein YeaZ